MTLYLEGFNRFVASAVAPIASGWSDSSPGGIRTHWKTVPLHGARRKSVESLPAGALILDGSMTLSQSSTTDILD
jgi:hypothetical protein